MIWTEKEVARLYELRGLGLSLKNIGACLSRSEWEIEKKMLHYTQESMRQFIFSIFQGEHHNQ